MPKVRLKVRLKAEWKLFNELLEAQRKGIPLEKVLETYAAENGNKTNGTDTATDD